MNEDAKKIAEAFMRSLFSEESEDFKDMIIKEVKKEIDKQAKEKTDGDV